MVGLSSPCICAPPPRADALPARPSATPREVPLVAPPRRSRTKRPAAGPAAGSNTDLVRGCRGGGGGAGLGCGTPMVGARPRNPPPPMPSCFAVTLAEPLALLELWPLALGARQPGRAGLLRRVPAGARWVLGGLERGSWGGGPIQALSLFVSPGLSRGPSPVVLGSQDALPVATAFTEYVHAYFKGRDADRYGGPGGVGVRGTPPLPQSPRPAWGIR